TEQLSFPYDDSFLRLLETLVFLAQLLATVCDFSCGDCRRLECSRQLRQFLLCYLSFHRCEVVVGGQVLAKQFRWFRKPRQSGKTERVLNIAKISRESTIRIGRRRCGLVDLTR